MENENNRGRKKKEIDGEFAEILSKLLQKAKENGISQEIIAQTIGVSRQSLGKWANGTTVPDILDLKKLAKYFDVSADYLLGLTTNKTTNIELQAVCEYTGLNEKSIKNISSITHKYEDKYKQTLNLFFGNYDTIDFFEELANSVEFSTIEFRSFIELLCDCGYSSVSFEYDYEKRNFIEAFINDKISLSDYKSNRILVKIQENMVKSAEDTIDSLAWEMPYDKTIAEIAKELSDYNARKNYGNLFSHMDEEGD